LTLFDTDYAFRQALSPTAKEACEIVSKIRAEEQRTIWTREYEDSLSQSHPGDIYPGMMFSLAKGRMEGTKLWNIIRKMPKGTLLHCHLDATVDLDFVFDKLMTTPGMHIYCERPLDTPAVVEKQLFGFIYSKTSSTDSKSIWTSEYTPSALIPVNDAAAAFPNGGRAGFLKWVKDRSTITHDESLAHHGGVNDVWLKFMAAFRIIASIIYYEPIFRAFIRQFCKQLLADGVQWVDLRAGFVQPYRQEGADKVDEGFTEMIRVMIEEVDKFKATEEGKNFWGMRLIWTGIRIFDQDVIIKSMYLHPFLGKPTVLHIPC
jgi:adenosine deaminase CECR1